MQVISNIYMLTCVSNSKFLSEKYGASINNEDRKEF